MLEYNKPPKNRYGIPQTIKDKPLTVDGLFATFMEAKKQFMGVPSEIKCGHAFYRKLNKLVPGTNDKLILNSFYGIRVVVDPDLKPNEWRLE